MKKNKKIESPENARLILDYRVKRVVSFGQFMTVLNISLYLGMFFLELMLNKPTGMNLFVICVNLSIRFILSTLFLWGAVFLVKLVIYHKAVQKILKEENKDGTIKSIRKRA